MHVQDVHKMILRVTQGLLILSFLLPLIVVPNGFIFPFVVPRVIFFRIAITCALAGYILLLSMDYERYRPKLDAITAVVFCFFASLILSTLFSVDTRRSLWDNHERMLGMFTLLHYGFLYVIAQNVFRTWGEWRRVWWAFMVVSVGSFLVGFIQIFNHEFLLNRDATRIASTLGNPIYVSAYGIFVFLLSIFMVLKEEKMLYKVLSGAIGMLAFINFAASNTRGTSIGFVVALVVIPVVAVFLVPAAKRFRKWVAVGLCCGAVLAFLFYNFRHLPAVYNFPIIGRLSNIALQGTTAETRFIAWNIAVQGWKENPIFGWGPVNFFYVFNKYYNPQSALHGLEETWFDNAHSMLFNTLAERGAVGLVSYLLIFTVPLLVLFKKRNKEGGILLFLFGFSFLLIHFIHNTLVFENATSYLYFFLFLAFVSSFTRFFSEDESQSAVQPLSSVLAVIVGVGTLMAITVFNLQPARANMGVFYVLSHFPPLQMYTHMQKSVEMRTPHIDDVRSDLSSGFLRNISNPQTEAEARIMFDSLLFLRKEQQKTVDEFAGMDIRTYLSIATLNRYLFYLTGNKEFLADADLMYAKAAALSPKRQQVLLEWSGNKLLQEDGEGALALVEKAVAFEPRLVSAQVRRATLAFHVGKFDIAADAQFKALERHYRPAQEEEKEAVVKIFAASPFTTEEIKKRLDAIEVPPDSDLKQIFKDIENRVPEERARAKTSVKK